MKTIFIPAKYTGKVDLSKINVDNLPKKLGLVTTVQFLDIVDNIKKYLKKNSKEIFIGKGKQKNPGQVLGCDISTTEKIKDKVDAFLYIGSGEFHPLGVALNTKKEVFTFNPVSNVFSKINNNDIEKYKKIRKAKYVKFLHADNIGILVSTKPGQENLKQAEVLKKKLENKNKKKHIFISNNIDINQFENFNIQSWVNTACPGLANDSSDIINIGDIPQ